MSPKIDLHTHTTASDGMLTPREIVKLAARLKVKYLGITDHDTTIGLRDALDEAGKWDVEVIPGVELSVEWPTGEMHILGYYVPPEWGKLEEKLAELREDRRARASRIIEKLKGLGIILDLDEIYSIAGESVGRPHIARLMVSKGYVSSVEEAFEKYLRKGAPAYVEKRWLKPFEAVKLLRECGAIPVLAHPTTLNISASGLDKLISRLKSIGLMGIEVYTPIHSESQVEIFRRIAEKHGLICTGGTDFHGDEDSGVELAMINVPMECVRALKDAGAIA